MTELSLHILDIAQNSISARAKTLRLNITELSAENELIIEIIDDGCGMNEQAAQMATDPYYTSRTTRKVGMGLPLLKQAAEQCNGSLRLESKLEHGTTVTATFELNHLDRQPMGDLAGVLVLLMISNPSLHIVYNHSTNQNTYTFDSNEIYKILDGFPVANPEVKKYISEIINSNLNDIQSVV